MRLWAVRFLRGLWGCGGVSIWLPLDRHGPTNVVTHLSVHLKVLCEWSLAALSILAEGAIALSVTLSGGALFAS